MEVRLEGDGCPLADASRATNAAIDADPPQLRDDGYALLRFSAPADQGLADALDADDRLRYLHAAEADGRMLFRCLSLEPCVVHALVSARASSSSRCATAPGPPTSSAPWSATRCSRA